MENIILSISLFLAAMAGTLFVVGRGWNGSFLSFLFADRSLKIGSAGLAISAHWFWAIAIFVGPAIAYNWGLIGLLWFVIPNALSLLVVGFITHRVREQYPDGYSLTQYIKENFSARVSALYQLEFMIIAFAALLLAFTAISKLWAFTGLGVIIDPTYVSLLVGLVTLLFTMNGGIRTSIFTGSVLSILWLVLTAAVLVAIGLSDFPFISLGKNSLDTFFNEKFITTFAVAWFITVMSGAVGHGMMWQKAFSMPKENILPSFGLASVVFAIVTFGVSCLGMFAFANGFDIKSPDTTQMMGLVSLMGAGALVYFATIVVGQTSTVIDSALNYVASLVSAEWLNKEQVATSRIIMCVFMLAAWLVSWAKIEIWSIVMLMGCIRVSMFTPIALHALRFNLKENVLFFVAILTIVGSFSLSYIARTDKLPIFDMYSALWAFFVPSITLLLTRNKNPG